MNEGMQELINGKAQIAMASRKVIPQEMEAAEAKGVELVEHLIGYGGIVIITDSENPVGELTMDQVRKVLTGKYTNWNSLGGKDQPIVVFTVGEKHPGTVCFVEQDILGGAPIFKEAKVLPDFPTIMQKVAVTPGSVAFTWGMIHEASAATAAVRCVFFIDPKMRIRAMVYYPLNVGRNFDEIMRVMDALLTVDEHSVACPANWKPGDPVIVPPPGTVQAAEDRLAASEYQVTDWYFSKKEI